MIQHIIYGAQQGVEYFLVGVKSDHWVITEHYEGDYEGDMYSIMHGIVNAKGALVKAGRPGSGG
ncbi:MAG: hypothetical protein P8J26_00275 [Pseudomonadales bacterium]|nr:hypothetical protein [Pseudomonadales bacterium]